MSQIKTIGLLKTFEKESHFWFVNPQISMLEPFRTLYNEDKSKTKKESSDIMWFIALCYDQSIDNDFRNIPLEERLLLMGESIFNDEKYFNKNKDKLIIYINKYLELCESPAMRALRAWNEKIEERALFIKETKYTLENAKELDTMMGNTKKIFDEYQRILKDITMEGDSEEGIRGGQEPSLTDKGRI